MKVNLIKIKVINVENTNEAGTYTVNKKVLGSIEKQRDLSVQVKISLKVVAQVDTVTWLRRLKGCCSS